MLLTGLLLLAALPVQGNLELTLDQAVYATEAAGAQLEMSYDIPHTSLTFLRVDSGFLARFRVGVDLIDARGNPVSGDFWERRVDAASYETTVERGTSVIGTVTLAIPVGAVRVRLQVADLGSQRRATSDFRLAESSTGLRLRFLRSGEPSAGRVYTLGETLEVRAEVLDRGRPDSVRFAVRDGRKALFTRAAPVEDSAGRAFARLAEPLTDSAGAARIPGGEYLLEARGTGGSPGLRAQAGFRFKVPFYYDESAWREKVDELLWVATVEQMRELRGLVPDRREEAWRAFWRQFDPTPTTGRNEKEEQYFERIEYAKDNFGRGDRGYRSQRAHVYVKLGPPDQLDSRPFELDSYAYEVWTYYSLSLEFLFVDRYGFGEYVLESPRSWDVR